MYSLEPTCSSSPPFFPIRREGFGERVFIKTNFRFPYDDFALKIE